MGKPKTIAFVLLLALTVCVTAICAQEATVQIAGDVKHPLSVSSQQLSAMERATLRVSNGDKEQIYEGVWLHQLLDAAGAPLGGALRGKALTSYVVVTADDGYQVVYSLAEIDPSFNDNQVLLADKLDGRSLPAEAGPFRVIAPRDKPGARWVRRVKTIEVVRLSK